MGWLEDHATTVRKVEKRRQPVAEKAEWLAEGAGRKRAGHQARYTVRASVYRLSFPSMSSWCLPCLWGSSSYEEILPHVVHLDITFYLSPVPRMPACLTYEVILRTSEWAFENLGRLSPPKRARIFRGPPDHIDENDHHFCSKAYILKGETSCFDW
jgi:hypothetical protein